MNEAIQRVRGGACRRRDIRPEWYGSATICSTFSCPQYIGNECRAPENLEIAPADKQEYPPDTCFPAMVFVLQEAVRILARGGK